IAETRPLECRGRRPPRRLDQVVGAVDHPPERAVVPLVSHRSRVARVQARKHRAVAPRGLGGGVVLEGLEVDPAMLDEILKPARELIGEPLEVLRSQLVDGEKQDETGSAVDLATSSGQQERECEEYEEWSTRCEPQSFHR